MWGIIADGACGKENVGINCGIGGLQGDPDLARYSAVRCLWWSCSKVFPCCKENNWICESLFCTGHTSWPWTKVEGGASICSVPRSMLWCKRRRIFLANAERTKTVGFARSRFQFHRCNFCKVSHGRAGSSAAAAGSSDRPVHFQLAHWGRVSGALQINVILKIS